MNLLHAAPFCTHPCLHPVYVYGTYLPLICSIWEGSAVLQCFALGSAKIATFNVASTSIHVVPLGAQCATQYQLALQHQQEI